MIPASYNITLYRGDFFDLPLRIRERLVNGQAGEPIDLTDCTILSQIRSAEDDSAILATFAVTLGAGVGELVLSLTPAQTLAFVTGVYDVQVTYPDTKPRTYLRGTVNVLKDVSREPTP